MLCSITSFAFVQLFHDVSLFTKVSRIFKCEQPDIVNSFIVENTIRKMQKLKCVQVHNSMIFRTAIVEWLCQVYVTGFSKHLQRQSLKFLPKCHKRRILCSQHAPSIKINIEIPWHILDLTHIHGHCQLLKAT